MVRLDCQSQRAACCAMQGQFEPCACQQSSQRPRLARLKANKRLSSRGRLRTAAKRGPARPLFRDSPASPPPSRRHKVKAVWDGSFGSSTLPSADKKRANRARGGKRRPLRKFSKQLKAVSVSVRSDQSLPANGQFDLSIYRECSS